MKTRLLTLLMFMTLTLKVSAQVPQSMNYQAVARDANGVIMSNQNISIQLSVLDGSATGTVAYMERHNVTTNTFGLFTVAVGQGQAMTGSFSTINWASGSKWMKVELDPNGGTTYSTMGVSQLLSVPYALYAANGGSSSVNVNPSISGNGTAANPLSIAQQGASVGQTLIWNGTSWVPGSITGADNWGTQSAVTALSLTGNGTAASPLDIASQGASSGQVLGWNGSAWTPVTLSSGTGAGDNWGSQVAITSTTISGNGTAASPLNIAQQGASAGQVLKWNGATWVPSTDNTGSTYTAGTGINIAGTVISNTGDTNPLDDITNTTAAGGDLTGTYPNPTVANIQNHPVSTTMPSSGQVLTWNGAAWTPATPNTGTTYTAGTGISIAGTVISNTGDLSATNELQTLSIAGNQLTISSGNTVTLPSSGGGSYTGGTGITITGSNVINSNWTLSGSDIYNNNAGNVGVGGIASSTDKLLVTPGAVNGGLRINKTNANTGSYGLWSLNNYTGHNSVVTSGFKGTTVYSGWSFSDPALHVNQTNGNTGMIVLRKKGTSTIAPGIAALNGDGIGGFFYTADSSKAGMDALVGYYDGGSTFAVGVRGRFLGSSRGYGMEGDYIGTSDTAGGVLGYGINNSGALGNHSFGVVGVYKFSNSYGAGVWGIAGDSVSVFPGAGTDYGVFGGDPNGFGFAVYGDGAMACTGTKSASVPTSQGNQLVYSIESPENWFEDFGTATLVNGVATINLDPMFMEVVVIDAQHPMVVTVTPEGECNGVYVVKGTNSFQIKELNNGHSNVSVSYRITAKRANYQDHRFGSDPTFGAGDTRSKFHYVSPRPMNYDTMVELTRAKKASKRSSGSNVARPGSTMKVLEVRK